MLTHEETAGLPLTERGSFAAVMEEEPYGDAGMEGAMPGPDSVNLGQGGPVPLQGEETKYKFEIPDSGFTPTGSVPESVTVNIEDINGLKKTVTIPIPKLYNGRKTEAGDYCILPGNIIQDASNLEGKIEIVKHDIGKYIHHATDITSKIHSGGGKKKRSSKKKKRSSKKKKRSSKKKKRSSKKKKRSSKKKKRSSKKKKRYLR